MPNEATITRQCKEEYLHGIEYRQGRVKDWQATEDLYYGKVKKTLKGRFNVPIPVMPGFVDTLMSKIDDPPILRFRPTEEADFRPTQRLQAFYDVVSRSADADHESKDLDVKKLAIFYGRGIFKTYGERNPKFQFNLLPVDVYDFYCDGQVGDLEEARYCGQDNIFLSKSKLKEGVKSGLYKGKNVAQILSGIADNQERESDAYYYNKESRLSSLGLVSHFREFYGEGVSRLVESCTTYEGERYYVLWDYETALPIRLEKLKDVFESNTYPWVSWATHRDVFNFWSKAPADDVRPVAEVIKVLANQELDNRQKRNFGQRAYDPDMFDNAAELEYRPNGLVRIKSGSTQTRAISSGIYQFETPELNGTINLVEWLDQFTGQKTGVTADAQGVSDEKRVGIYEGNLQQVADRLGLFNKSYSKCYAAIGRRFVWACKEHLKEKQMVRVIGENGIHWDHFTGKNVNVDVDVAVEGGASELQVNQAKKTRREAALAAVSADPALAQTINAKWRAEQLLLNGEFTDEEVRVALDTENDGNREILARASEAIQEFLAGKEPKVYRGATTAFQQKILDYAIEETEDDDELFGKLIAYIQAHDVYVQENMMRRAMRQRAQAGQPPLGAPGAPVQAGGGQLPPVISENQPEPAIPAL